MCAFSSIFIYNFEIKYKKYFSVFIIILFVCYFKYHLKFNDERKFHEMSKINFDLSVDAKKIDKKLSGLKWITPIFPNSPEEEVKFLREIIGVLNAENSKAMVMSNYSFLSLLLIKIFILQVDGIFQMVQHTQLKTTNILTNTKIF